jgi:quercetin dioxygenase-like cupin family protein
MAEKIELKKFIEYSEGSIVSKQVLNKKTGTLTLFAFDAGQSLSEHTAPYDAAIQVIEGSARIKIGGEPYFLNEGEMIILPGNVPHAVYADARFKMMLVMILS